MLRAFQEIDAFWRARHRPIRAIRSDRGSNLISHQIKTWMAGKGIDSQPTAADNHHQVGQGEKAVDLLKTMARAWLADSERGDEFFAHALMHSAQARTKLRSVEISL